MHRPLRDSAVREVPSRVVNEPVAIPPNPTASASNKAETALSTAQAPDDDSSALPFVAPYVVAAYLTIACGMLLRLAISLWSGQKLRADSTHITERELLEMIGRLSRLVGLKVAPAVAYCERVAVPMVIGIIKPLVLVPANLVTGLKPEELVAIVSHELAHIRRYDLLVNLFQRLLESLLFFHPVVWYLSRRLSNERENCCDDLVVSAECERVEYVGALLRMAELCKAERQRPAVPAVTGLCATGTNPSQFGRRVLRLLGESDMPRLNLTRTGLLSTSFLAITLLAGGAWAYSFCAKQKPNTRKPAAKEDSPTATPSRTNSGSPTAKQAPGGSNRVVDLQGRPIAGARIELRTSYRPDHGKAIAETVSDQLGQFTYPDGTPEEDTFYVHVHADSFRPRAWMGNQQVYRLKDGVRQPDTLVLYRPVTVLGRIIGPNGQPMANADIAVDYFIEGGPANINGTRVKSDAAGRFRAEGLPPANIFVRYESPYDETHPRMPIGRQPAKLFIHHFKAKDGQTAEDIVLDLRKARCVVQGVIVDENGKGVANRWISATLAAAKGRLDESVVVKTDANGRFRFEGLSPHEYTIGTYTPSPRHSFRLVEGKPTDVRLTTHIDGRAPPKDRTVGPAWGEPNEDGIVAGLQLRPSRTEYSIGDTIRANVVIRNSGKQTRTIEYTFSAQGELNVLKPDNSVVARLNYGHFSGIALQQTYRLQPDQEVVVGSFTVGLVGTKDAKTDTPPSGATFGIPCRPTDRLKLGCNLSANVFGGSRKENEVVLMPTGSAEILVTARKD